MPIVHKAELVVPANTAEEMRSKIVAWLMDGSTHYSAEARIAKRKRAANDLNVKAASYAGAARFIAAMKIEGN